MSNPTKNYKIIVDSKHFGNMKGISTAEVAKKAAGKILGLSNNKITKFSMVETKNGKILNYKAFKENLIRPYHKNGKLIKCRIIVKKIGKHTGGGEAENLRGIYKKSKFLEEDKKKIKAAMVVIKNTSTHRSVNYDPYNLTENLKGLAGDISGLRNLVLGANDPIRHFFKNYSIEIDADEYGWMKMSYEDYEARRRITIKVNYDFSGDENSFSLNIYNLRNAIDREEFIQNCNKYVEFLKKIYTEAKISIDYGSNGSNSNGSNGSNNNVNSRRSNRSNIYNKPEFDEKDKKRIKNEMIIKKKTTGKSDNYDPYNLHYTIYSLTDGEIGGIRDLVLGDNDPVRYFFYPYSIEFNDSDPGWINIIYDGNVVNYEFRGNDKEFTLEIHNLNIISDKNIIRRFKKACSNYIEFLKKLYPDAAINYEGIILDM